MAFSNPARVSRITQPFLRLSADIPASTGIDDASEETVTTQLADAAGAAAVSARLAALVDPAFRLWTVTVPGGAYAYAPGDTVTITHPRYGLTPGKAFIIVAATHRDDGAADLTLLGGRA